MGFRLRLPSLVSGLLALLALLAGAPFVNPSQASPSSANAPLSRAEKVDINSATLEQLLKVPGMTRTWAARIIRFRPYRAKNELLDRGVVTSQIYDRIKDSIVAHRAKN